ncbi:MAG: hypothetical protein J6B24_09370 [Clostridia bacterium]|nr:hypothetical protein [Clostridia bacterium]
MVKQYKCYRYNEEWLLIEMVMDIPSSEIDWMSIAVPNEELDEGGLAVPLHGEQYLNADGTEKLCEVYDEPEEDACPCRVAFFIYDDDLPTLHTSYGDFPLDEKEELPARLKEIIEFDEED